MELVKIEEQKGINVPFRCLPEELLNTLVGAIVSHLEVKLSVNAEKEENQKRIGALLIEVKKSMWGLTPKYILNAFDAYINGQLSYDGKPLTPVSGYLDTILFKKVVNAYKNIKEVKQDKKAICLSVYEHWKVKKDLKCKGITEAFDYLYEVGLLPKKGENEKIDKRYEGYMKHAQGIVYATLVDQQKWMEKEDLQDTPAYKNLKKEKQKVFKNDHKDINPKFKELVLKGYFTKLKHDLSKLV